MQDNDELESQEAVTELLANDPDLAYLLPDTEEAVVDEEGEGEPTGKKKPVVPALDEQTQAILNQLKDNPDAVRRLLTPPQEPQQVQPQQPPQQQQQQFNPDAFAEQFEKDLLSDPKLAAKKMLNAIMQVQQQTRQQTLQEVEGRVSQVGTGTVDTIVESYLERAKADPTIDDEVRREMETLIENGKKQYGAQLGRLTPTQIRQGLDAALNEAYGKVMRRRASKQSAAPAPNYGGGGNARPIGKQQNLRLTDDERGFVRGLKDSGLFNEKEIKQELAKYRAEKVG